MDYYHDLVTQKSWEELKRLSKITDFVLIGGWAVYLYTKTLKSKDIDIIVSFDKLAILEKHYILDKNERLKKYQARREQVEIDIYLPYYSKIGIPVERLLAHTKEHEGFTLLDSNYLFVLKLFTLSKRGRSPKGRKDFIDTIALIKSEVIVWETIKQILLEFKLEENKENFLAFLHEYYEVSELSLNRHQFAKLKKKIVSSLQQS